MTNVHGDNVFLLSGQDQIAQISYRSGYPVNGPYVVNLNTVLKTLFPNYSYYRFRSARISCAPSSTGTYQGHVKLIFQEGTSSSAPTKDTAKTTPGYAIPAYFSGPFLPLPLAYLDKWYSADVDSTGQLQQAPSFTLYIVDYTNRTSTLQNALSVYLKVSVAATTVRPMISSSSSGFEDGGVGLASAEPSVEIDVDNDQNEEEEPEYVSEARKALKERFAKAQEMLLEEQASKSSQVSSKSFILPGDQTYANFGYMLGGNIIDSFTSEIKLRGRDKYTFDTGYGKSSVDFKLDLSQLKFVRSALRSYSTIVFEDLVISITPKSINRWGSHTSVTPYFGEHSVKSETQNMWHRSDPGDYRFVWNRYQPGPFTPFPHLYLDIPYNDSLNNPIPIIVLQFSGWGDSDVVYIFVDYKISLAGKRSDSTGFVGEDAGVGLSKL